MRCGVVTEEKYLADWQSKNCHTEKSNYHHGKACKILTFRLFFVGSSKLYYSHLLVVFLPLQP